MDTVLELIRILLAIGAFILWGTGHLVQLVLRLSGKRSNRLTSFLTSTREEFANHWIALGGVVVLVIVALVLKTAFDRSSAAGWSTLSVLVVGGLVVLWLFTRRRFLRVTLWIVGIVAAFVDLIFIIAMGVDHGALIATGLVLMQIAVALGIARVVSRQAFRGSLVALGGLFFLAAPILVSIGILLLDEFVGRGMSLSLLGLALIAAVAAPSYWLRHPDRGSKTDALPEVLGFVAYWVIALVSAAFVMSKPIGWGAAGLTLFSAALATAFAVYRRRKVRPSGHAASDPNTMTVPASASTTEPQESR